MRHGKQRLGAKETAHISVYIRAKTFRNVKRKALDLNQTISACVDRLLSDALAELRKPQ